MIRWTYLVPRLIILGLLSLAVWMSWDSLLRSALVHYGESFFGSRIEIGYLSSSLAEGDSKSRESESGEAQPADAHLFLQDLQIADPRDPNRNLIQADMAYLNIDVQDLLRRRFRIRSGKSSQVAFAAPRTTTGLLPNQSPRESRHTPNSDQADTVLPDRDEKTAETKWLDQLRSSVPAISENPSQSLHQAQRVGDQWNSTFAGSRRDISALNAEIDRIADLVEQDSANPLRSRYDDVLSEIDQLQENSAAIERQLANYVVATRSDLDSLVQAGSAIQDRLQQHTSDISFEAEALSNLLLEESQRQTVDEIMRWFAWFRAAIPEMQTDFRTAAPRGTNVVFAGKSPEPEFLIDSLNIEGSGRFANQHLNFAGNVFNLSSQPQHHSQPVTFDLRAQGNQHFVIHCTVDRRDDKATDTLSIRCPDLRVASAPLGTESSLLVSVGPNLKMQAEVKLHGDGDQISGELTFRHSHVSLHVDKLHDLAGGKDAALKINQQLAQFDQFQTKVRVSGTESNYRMQLESELGDLFAQALTHISNQAVTNKLTQQVERLKQQHQAVLSETERSISGPLAILIADSQQTQQSLDRLKKSVSETAQQAWPQIR